MIIVEIGWNFLGKLGLAKKMIDAAAKSGAKYLKFQIWDPKNLKKGPWDNDGRRAIYEKAYLDEKKFRLIYDYSKKKNLIAFASVFNLEGLKILKKVSNEYIKIPSVEAYNHELIEVALKNFKNVYVSTGALTYKELLSLKKFRKYKNFYPLHCVSIYPLNLQDTNFKKFFFLKKNFKIIGYSGHYHGIDDAIYAISHGAKFVEKHFTIDNKLKGRDNKFAILPYELKFLINYFKNSHIIETSKLTKGVLKKEKDVYSNYRGRWNKI
jgi:N,N'-diacetyllegionaminate synthase